MNLKMEHTTTIEILEGSHQKIYQIGAVQYDIHFPLHWALEPMRMENGYVCGPSECNNCLEYGSYHGVFIGYCLNCARAYGYERGNGFLDHGVEQTEGDGREAKNSVWNTYLKNVNLEEVGWHSWVALDPFQEGDWLSDSEEGGEKDADASTEEKEGDEKEGEVFRDMDSEVSDDSDYDDYLDYVDSESEHFCVRRRL